MTAGQGPVKEFEMLPQCQPGDVILLANMPWWVADMINYVQGGESWHHCAVVLPDPSGRSAVWEAVPPRVNYLWCSEYVRQIDEWAANWRYRWGRKPLICEVWRAPRVTSVQLGDAGLEATSWLGTKYRLVLNYTSDGPGIHCSEFVCRCLVAGAMLWADDFKDSRGRTKPPSRRTPWDLRVAMERNGWKIVGPGFDRLPANLVI